jgi:hypothetical protein
MGAVTEPPNLDKGQQGRPADDRSRWTDQSVPPTAPPGAAYPGQQHPNPYAAHPYGAQPWGGFAIAPPDHPQTTTILVLGIIGIVACQVTAPFAWVMGRRALAEIDQSGGQVGGRSQVQVGYILGIVGSVLLGIAVLVLVVYAVLAIALVAGTS